MEKANWEICAKVSHESSAPEITPMMNRIRRTSLVLVATALFVPSCASTMQATGSTKRSRPTVAAPQLSLHGPTQWKPFEHATISRQHGPSITVYVGRHATPRPTLVLVHGSHCLPLIMASKQRTVSALIFQPHLHELVERVNVVVVEKRGLTSFVEPPATEQEARALAKCTEAHGGVEKSERVDDLVIVMTALEAQPWVSGLHLLGHSEGGDVVAGAIKRMRSTPKLRSAGFLAGVGPTRFFEYVVQARESKGAPGAAAVIEENGKCRAVENPNRVVMAALAGPTTPVKVGSKGTYPTLNPSCNVSINNKDNQAVPAIRIRALVNKFSAKLTAQEKSDAIAKRRNIPYWVDAKGKWRHENFSSICTTDFSPALKRFAERITARMGTRCKDFGAQ